LDRLLTVDEAAERLGTSTRFVRRLIFERRIAFVKVGRHVRITPSDLDAYIAAARIDALRRRAEAG
jgi:excisionase family DNA binding protein